MDTTDKLELLASHMSLEPAEEYRLAPEGAGVGLASCGFSPAQPTCGSGGETSLKSKQEALGIHHAVMPGGKRIALLKTLLTSACERDCYYCPFRAGGISAVPPSSRKRWRELFWICTRPNWRRLVPQLWHRGRRGHHAGSVDCHSRGVAPPVRLQGLPPPQADARCRARPGGACHAVG